METRLRQRVIGGVVLAALAIIFLPLFFKSSNPIQTAHAPVIISDQIPAPPPKPSENTINQAQTEPVDNRVVTLTQNGDSLVASVSETPQPQTNQTIANQAQAQAQAQAKSNVFTNSQEPVEHPAANTQSQSVMMPAAAPVILPLAPSSSLTAAPKSTDEAAVSQTLSAAEDQVLDHKPEVKTEQAKKAEEPKMIKQKANPKAITLGSWAVQLGAFTDEVNAKKLIKQLQTKGFAAYLEKVKTNKGEMVRVLIGPETKKVKAQAIMAKLDKQMQLKGVVVPYELPLFK